MLDFKYKALPIIKSVRQTGDNPGQLKVLTFQLSRQGFKQSMPSYLRRPACAEYCTCQHEQQNPRKPASTIE
jgi:hypothetical protein